jgi:hypothetical protein
MPSYPRSELEERMNRWLQANKDAERDGDWSSPLSLFYAEDAEYRWNMGPNQECVFRGRQEIRDVALGYHMKGFEEWQYPYHTVIIDEQKGLVIGLYDQVSPTGVKVAGVSGTLFEYGGNFQWRRQRDFFDLGNVKAVMFQMAGENRLAPIVKQKVYEQARGNLLPGIERISEERSICAKLNDFMAMLKIVVFGY